MSTVLELCDVTHDVMTYILRVTFGGQATLKHNNVINWIFILTDPHLATFERLSVSSDTAMDFHCPEVFHLMDRWMDGHFQSVL